MQILILSGGSLDLSFAASYLKEHQFDHIIVADGGMNQCRTLALMPDEIYGDFDSADSDALEWFRGCEGVVLHQFPSEKDETDTELTLLAAMKRIEQAGVQDHSAITILGGTGTRLDHVLGNIHLLKMSMERGISCYLVDAHNRIRMIDHGITMKKADQFGKYVSLLPFTEQVSGITLRGFAYNVTDFTLVSGISRGVSNQMEEAQADIDFQNGILLVIESMD